MGCALHDMGKHVLPARLLQGFGRSGQRLHRHHVISIAMHQQNGRAHAGFIGQRFRRQQAPRKSHDACNRIFAARRHMQADHCALAKAEQHHLFGQQIFVHQQRIQKGVQIIACRAQTAFGLFLGRAIKPGNRKPLVAIWQARNGFRRIGGHKQRVGQMFAQNIGQPQKIGAIGTIAVQKHHNRAGFARNRLFAASGQDACHRVPSRCFSMW